MNKKINFPRRFSTNNSNYRLNITLTIIMSNFPSRKYFGKLSRYMYLQIQETEVFKTISAEEPRIKFFKIVV